MPTARQMAQVFLGDAGSEVDVDESRALIAVAQVWATLAVADELEHTRQVERAEGGVITPPLRTYEEG
jgi:hypothetical protein